ncbi:MAG: HDIG domain-containing protein, partial [Spirochaetales bacterium]|nr:HDIG domain-containing protein [Spirochaetales bacterium]
MKIKTVFSTPEKNIIITLLITFFIVFLIILISTQYTVFFTKFRLSGFEEGKVAPRDLIASNNYSYIDSQASELKVESELSLIFPIFEMDNEKIKSVINSYSLFSQQYLQYKDSPSDINKIELSSNYGELFDPEELKFLLNDVDPYLLIPKASELIEFVLEKGVFDQTNELSYSYFKKIQLWEWEKGRKIFSIVNSDEILTTANLSGTIDTKLLLLNITESEKYAIKLVVNKFITETVFYNEIQTQLRYDEIRKEIEPVLEEIHSGDYIIKRGFIVSKQDMEKALVLNTKEKKINIIQISITLMFLILLFSFSIIMFKPLFRGKKRKYQYTYLLLSFYIIFILYTSLILQFNFILGYNLSLFLPVALLSMMIVILIGFQESILMVIILSISLFIFPTTTIPVFMFSFVSGISAAFLMKSVKKRIDLVKPALYLAVINILALLLEIPQNADINWVFVVILLATLNAFISSILNVTLIPVFEHFLNIPTVFRLMELSDMNAPLFRKMVTMAPGTYGHSMAVANLADAACRDIGANALLARVGAYYHDIGKL